MPTKRASARSRTKLAKAALISPLVLALKTWICSPMARAADCTSLNVNSTVEALAGLTSTATRAACGHQLTQQLQPLRRQLNREKIDTCQVAAGLGEARNKTELDRVFADDEDDGDRGGRRLCRKRRRSASRGDHGKRPANQFGRQPRQSIVLVFGPTVYDRHVLALDIAAVFEALAECAQTVRARVRRCGAEEPDHRQRRLLRARGERPNRRSAAENAMNTRLLIRSPRRRGQSVSAARRGRAPWRS